MTQVSVPYSIDLGCVSIQMDKAELERTFANRRLIEDVWGNWKNGIIKTVSLKSDHEIKGSILFELKDIENNEDLKNLVIRVYELAIKQKDGNLEQQQTYQDLVNHLKQA